MKKSSHLIITKQPERFSKFSAPPHLMNKSARLAVSALLSASKKCPPHWGVCTSVWDSLEIFSRHSSFSLRCVSVLLPAATKLGQGNIFTSVCQEFCPRGGGVCLSACWDTPPPPGADPPGTRHPPTAAYGQRAAGTHPTGMHSCCYSLFTHLKQNRLRKWETQHLWNSKLCLNPRHTLQ